MLRRTLAEITILDALLGAGELPGRHRVVVRCPDGEARFVVDGGLVECRGASWMGWSVAPAAVVFDLMRRLDGDIVIEASPQESMSTPVGMTILLRGLDMLASEWQALLADVPSMHSRLQLWTALSRRAVVLDARWWALVTTVGSGATFCEVMERLELDELAARRMVSEALAWGLVTVNGRPGRAQVTYRSAGDETATTPAPPSRPQSRQTVSIGVSG
jgi:hypothetical protein